MSKNVFWPFFQCPLLAHFFVNTSLYINIETTEGETGQQEISITEEKVKSAIKTLK